MNTPMHDQQPKVEFPPGYLEKAEKYTFAGRAAENNPVPGPLVDAFAAEPIPLPEPIARLGFKLRDPVASDLVLLSKMESPLPRELAEQVKPEADREAVTYTDQDFWNLFYLFTRPMEEARAVVMEGRKVFELEVLRATADKMGLGLVKYKQDIMVALATNIARAFATALEYEARQPEDGKSFTQPPGAQATGSAGGSK